MKNYHCFPYFSYLHPYHSGFDPNVFLPSPLQLKNTPTSSLLSGNLANECPGYDINNLKVRLQ